MTSGKRTSPSRKRPAAGLGRRAALVGALTACAVAWAQGATVFDLDALMALLAQRKSGEARFTEERTVTGFDSPLRASGTLSFTAPGTSRSI